MNNSKSNNVTRRSTTNKCNPTSSGGGGAQCGHDPDVAHNRWYKLFGSYTDTDTDADADAVEILNWSGQFTCCNSQNMSADDEFRMRRHKDQKYGK
ncbi:hypothetical protein ACLKA6_008861 [Drosophila palustris]